MDNDKLADRKDRQADSDPMAVSGSSQSRYQQKCSTRYVQVLCIYVLVELLLEWNVVSECQHFYVRTGHRPCGCLQINPVFVWERLHQIIMIHAVLSIYSYTDTAQCHIHTHILWYRPDSTYRIIVLKKVAPVVNLYCGFMSRRKAFWATIINTHGIVHCTVL